MKKIKATETQRMCFALPAKMHRRLKLQAAMNGDTIQGIIIRAIEQAFSRAPRGSAEAQEMENPHE
jgi:hypothetical protein